jgi:hypothetical protein
MGRIINVEVLATIKKQWFLSNIVKLTGRGEVVRVDELNSFGNDRERCMKKFGIAMYFVDKLKLINE